MSVPHPDDWFMIMIKSFENNFSQQKGASNRENSQSKIGDMLFTSKKGTIGQYIFPSSDEPKISHIFPVDKNLFGC